MMLLSSPAVLLLLAAAGVVNAYPDYLICEDPRFVEGARMMNNYVTMNQASGDLFLNVSATTYIYGEAIKLTIQPGPTWSRLEGQEVYFAIQVDFLTKPTDGSMGGGNGEAMGQFFEFSPNVRMAGTAGGGLDGTGMGCSSTVHGDFFDGPEASLLWMPWKGKHRGDAQDLRTSGDATFKLLWGNGPSSSDPSGVAVPDSFMYMKTVTVEDPNTAEAARAAPPAKQGEPNACVDTTTRKGHSYKDAPVFIQHVDEDESQTFPTRKCVRCRFDQRHVCRSAKVVCPRKPGGAVLEETWLTSPNCEGEPTRTARVPDDFVTCPGPAHYSVSELNLDRFVPKLLRDQSAYFKSEAEAKAAIEEYRKMLTIVQRHPGKAVVPSKLVDLVWHEHILDTQAYKRDTLRVFGHYLDHSPSFGGDDEKMEMVQQQMDMLHLFEMEFGSKPNTDVWPSVEKLRGLTEIPDTYKRPDCCSFECAKPNCEGCVGCNALLCGYKMESDPASAKKRNTPLSPEKYAGYVATARPLKAEKREMPDREAVMEDEPTWDSYKCSIDLKRTETGLGSEMKLGWSITEDGYIHFQHLFVGEAWYGYGLNTYPEMGYGDYYVTVFGGTGGTPLTGGSYGNNGEGAHGQGTGNYTRIMDLYKFDRDAGYPCYDHTWGCSENNATMGEISTEDGEVSRAMGYTISSWNRALSNDDIKDLDISEELSEYYVMFAHGEDDGFEFHRDTLETCKIDFYSGAYDCGYSSKEARAKRGPRPAEHPRTTKQL